MDRQANESETAYTMDRHYKLLKAELGYTRQNHEVVQQLLDLEFPARKLFAASISQHEARATKVLQRYSCFGEPLHENDSVDVEASHYKRTAFLAVKQMEDNLSNLRVYVVVNGKALITYRSLVDGFVCLVMALCCFQQPHPCSITPAMVLIEHHILKDAKVNKKDRKSAAFKKAYEDYNKFMSRDE
ncbi:Hypp6940 [Branchiostoma lanceolatum]|uniref:Hypp6940 protein n=1 Tax=Branchiostoma lanceolatum TaxID=7740 RepID=A0A8J9YW11_BRALA|nr:Hypp6940 [Branchiostoma lanceolatum]